MRLSACSSSRLSVYLSSRRSSCLITCLLSLSSFPASDARALLLPGYSAGSGANTSQLIIDFAFLDSDAYLFTYHYDGQATAEQMLLALDAAGELTVHHQYFTFGGPPSIFINGFTFAGNSSIPVFEGTNGESWTLWTVNDPLNNPTAWSSASIGPTDRPITDGSIDGWSLNISSFNTKGLPATNNPPTSIPEPTSAVLLALASIAVSRRRRD